MLDFYVFDNVHEMVYRALDLLTWESITSLGVLVLSMILSIIYVGKWQRNFDVNFSIIYIIIPISCMGTFAYSFSGSMSEAMLSQKIIYLGGCFLIYFITMAIFNLCNINAPKVLRVIMLTINSLIYLSVVTTEITKLFYRSVGFEMADGSAVLSREYGPMHTVFMIIVIVYFAMAFLVTFISLIFRKNLPKSRAVLLLIMLTISVSAFFAGRFIPINLDFTTMSYVFAQIIFLIIIRRVSLYSIKDGVADTILTLDTDGYISFDKRFRYLGCIGIAGQVYPELKNIKTDKKITKVSDFPDELRSLLDEFAYTGKATPKTVTRKIAQEASQNSNSGFKPNKRIYQLTINTLFNGKKEAGYQVHIADDTYDMIQINMLDSYNDYLHKKVEAKTANIQKMHDNLILSMAMMVESRDNSTGGHIRRTSDCVRIFLDEMKKDPGCELVKGENGERFCRNMIKAAPMHDLGKIAVRDSILQKPGKFEDWEFEEMKKHAEEGARIVHEILKNTDDNKFHLLAENVAHYHHERWDGSGYPKGLVGEAIPIEARIMAIADVYDALVSKRVYKERMSFEKADSIIMDGMGKHFDPSLEKYYVAARPHFEAYYEREDQAETEQKSETQPTPEVSPV